MANAILSVRILDSSHLRVALVLEIYTYCSLSSDNFHKRQISTSCQSLVICSQICHNCNILINTKPHAEKKSGLLQRRRRISLSPILFRKEAISILSVWLCGSTWEPDRTIASTVVNRLQQLSIVALKTLDISQDSVVTYLRCAGIFTDSTITHFLLILTVK